MADKTTDQSDDEFDGFENLDENFDDGAVDTSDALVDDAEFEDMADTIDADVFEDDTQPAAPAKKKTNWFNIIVAVVAIAGAGGLILNKLGPQLMGGGSASSIAGAQMAAPDPMATNPGQSEAAAQAALEPQQSNVPAGGMLDNPDAFAQLAGDVPAANQQPDQGAIPDPFAGLNKPDSGGVPMPAPITAEPVAQAPAPALETAPLPAMPEPVATMPAVPAQAVTATPILPAPVDNTALKGDVNKLSDRMDSMETKLDAALAGISRAQKTVPVAAPADDTRFNAIQKTLERLESRLNDISTTRASAPVRRVDIADDEPAPVVVKKKKSLPKKAAAPKKQQEASSGWDEPYAPSKTAATPVSTGSSANTGGWDLRGAQPGSAIIGKVGGDVRQVSVGDTVPGLGQITGIATINNRWIVQGTQGRLAQ